MFISSKKKHMCVLYLTAISTFLSAVIVSYESLPEALRDNLPVSFNTMLTTLTLFSSGLASIVHMASNKPYPDDSHEENIDKGPNSN